MKTQNLFPFLAIFFLFNFSNIHAQEVDPNSYILLHVDANQTLNLSFNNIQQPTEIKIVSGTAEAQYHLDANQAITESFTPADTLVTLYGRFENFDCSNNQSHIRAIDPSHCPTLEYLDCSGNNITALDVSQNNEINTVVLYNNPFTTQAYDDLICSLPDRVSRTPGRCFPLENANSPDTAIYNLATSNNARMKSWLLRYANNSRIIPPTRGEYICQPLPINPDNYVTLRVTPNQPIQLHPAAITFATTMRIISGTLDTTFSVHADASCHLMIIPRADTLRFIGNLKILFCGENYDAVQGLTVNNSTLRFLDVHDDALQSINIISAPQLYHLELHNNQLTTLDASQLPALNYLTLYNNNFTTTTYDELFCTMPHKATFFDATAFLLEDPSNSFSTLESTNTTNAIDKNWSLEYYNTTTPLPESHGTYQCELNIAHPQSTAITIYPNPAQNQIHILNIETLRQNATTSQYISIYNLQGKRLIHEPLQSTLDISTLHPGIYILTYNNHHTKLLIQ